MSANLFQALGARDEADALRIVEQTNKFLATLRESTGDSTLDAATLTVRASIAVLRSLEQETGAVGDAAVAKAKAWKAAFETMPDLQKKLAEQDESIRVHEISMLIAQGLKDNQLVPVTAEYWKTRTAGELAAFLKVAPRVIAAHADQPSRAPNSAGEVVTPEGKKYEDLMPAARAELQRENPDLYAALRSNWIERGEPIGIVAGKFDFGKRTGGPLDAPSFGGNQ